MDNNTEKRLTKLIESAKEAVDLLTEEIKKPVDEDLQDDKARNAFKSKKECFMDAKDLILEIEKMEGLINGEIEDTLEDDKKDFKAGAVERFAKRPSK
jgi:hypothetical protein